MMSLTLYIVLFMTVLRFLAAHPVDELESLSGKEGPSGEEGTSLEARWSSSRCGKEKCYSLAHGSVSCSKGGCHYECNSGYERSKWANHYICTKKKSPTPPEPTHHKPTPPKPKPPSHHHCECHSLANGYSTCSEGRCSYHCDIGFGLKGFDTHPKCINVSHDVNNCGRVGHSCHVKHASLPVGYPKCHSGECVYCPKGYRTLHSYGTIHCKRD